MGNRFFKYIFLLIILSLVIFFRWLNFSVFTYSDISYVFSEALRGYLPPSVWVSSNNLGFLDTLIWRLPFYTMLGIIGNFGYGSNVAEKLLYFWPIILLAPIGSFLIVRKVCKDDLAGFIGSLVFTYNTYFLSINTQGHQLLTLAFILSVFALYFYILYLEKKTFIFAALTVLTLFVINFYDLRALYIVVFILVLYLAYFTLFISKSRNKILNRNILNYILPYIIFLPLISYWVLPTIVGSSLITNENFGRLISYSEFYNIIHAVTLHFPFWTSSTPLWDTFIFVPWYFWLYPAFAILGLLLNRKRPIILFFGLIALIGILLTKQVAIPFDKLYLWLYENIPGFNAFREASKFYFMIVLGYSILIGSFISKIKEKSNTNFLARFAKQFLFFGIIFLVLWNTKSIVTGEIGTLFIPTKIPKDIIKTKNFIFNQNNFFRTAWIHPPVRWTLASNNHPLIDMNYFTKSKLTNFPTYSHDSAAHKGKSILNNLADIRMDKVLDLTSVKYVMVMLDENETNDLIFNSIGINGVYVKDRLKSINYLNSFEIDTSNILVYENKAYRPHIYTTLSKEQLLSDAEYFPVNYVAISPSEYRVMLYNIDKPIFLHFTDAYDPQWVMKVGNFDWPKSILDKNYFLSNKYHIESPVNTNSFLIDPNKLCSNNNCIDAGNGKYDITLTLFFKPQAYLMSGLVITAITLVTIIVIAFYIIIKMIKNYA